MVIKNPGPYSTSLCDSHIHTRLCGHAVGEMEEYVQVAIGKGLKKIIFLEHMEEGIEHTQGKTWLSADDFDAYFAEGERLQAAYEDKIVIGLGVECGYNPACRDILQARLAERPRDQIGISCHFLKINGMADHLNMFSSKERNILLARQIGGETILDRYFTTLTEAVRFLPGTMVCHLDAALRYLPEITLTESHYVLIDTLLQAIKAKGLAVEINSSGFAMRREQFPNRRILAMAKSYSIPFIFGSDAHKPGDVGRYFDLIESLPL
jgi:histidinol-phosphatase (PHP family)